MSRAGVINYEAPDVNISLPRALARRDLTPLFIPSRTLLSRARARAHSLYASFRANTTYIGSVFPGLGEMSSAAGGSNPPAKW